MMASKTFDIPISEVFASSNRGVSEYKTYGEKGLFWEKCLEIARDHQELSAEEVEYKAVLAQVGLFC